MISLRDNLIKAVIVGMVRRANEKHDMQEVLSTHGADGRTMSIVITDIDGGYGFSVENSKIVTSSIENPTCIVSMDKKTFSAIVTNKITPTQAFFRNNIIIDGNDWLRDSIVVNKIFDEVKDAMLSIGK